MFGGMIVPVLSGGRIVLDGTDLNKSPVSEAGSHTERVGLSDGIAGTHVQSLQRAWPVLVNEEHYAVLYGAMRCNCNMLCYAMIIDLRCVKGLTLLRTTTEILGEALLTVFCVGKNIPRPRSRVRTGRVKCGWCGCAGTRGHGAEIAETSRASQQPRLGWWCGAGRNTQHCKSGADRQQTERAGAGVLEHCAPLLRRSGKRRGEMAERTPGVVSTPEHRQNAKYCQIALAEARSPEIEGLGRRLRLTSALVSQNTRRMAYLAAVINAVKRPT